MIIESGTWEYDTLTWMKPAWGEFNFVEVSETAWAATDRYVLYLAERKSEIPIGHYAVKMIGDTLKLVDQFKYTKFPNWGNLVNGEWQQGEFKIINSQGRSKRIFFNDIDSILPNGIFINPALYDEALAGMDDRLFYAHIPVHKKDGRPVLIYPDERDRMVYIMTIIEYENDE